MDAYDMECEILSRITSLQTLYRCKAVCKRWYDIIDEASFCQNTRDMYGYIIQVSNSKLKFSKTFLRINQHDHNKFIPSCTDLKFDNVGTPSSSDTNLKFDDDDDIEIVASSMQGIMCCVKLRGFYGKFYVCKPTTGQREEIPDRIYFRGMAGLIILSTKPLRYKILLITSPSSRPRESQEEEDFCCDIFYSKTWTWYQRVKLSLPSTSQLPFKQLLLFNKHGIQVGRYLYFLRETLILAFHGDDDTTSHIPLPSEISSSNYLETRKVIEYQGNLGLISMTRLEWTMQLWILDDVKIQKWMKIKEVDMRLFPGQGSIFHPVGFYNANTVVMRRFIGTLILWNIQDFSYKEVKLNGLDTLEIFPFRSDWEHVDLRPEAPPLRSDQVLMDQIMLLIVVATVLIILITFFSGGSQSLSSWCVNYVDYLLLHLVIAGIYLLILVGIYVQQQRSALLRP